MNWERYNRFVQLDRAGWSAPRIAARLDVNVRTISRWRRREGTSQPTTAPYPERVWVRAEELLADGCPYIEVAETLGVSNTTVAAHFPGHGWSKADAGSWVWAA